VPVADPQRMKVGGNFRLISDAQKFASRGFNYLAKVIRGVKFNDGIEVESDNQVAA